MTDHTFKREAKGWKKIKVKKTNRSIALYAARMFRSRLYAGTAAPSFAVNAERHLRR
jgi:hypothetical protein